MSKEQWVFEAIERAGSKGASIREIQRFIDDNHYEELAINTIKQVLERLEIKQQVKCNAETWQLAKQTSKDDALKKLFGD